MTAADCKSDFDSLGPSDAIWPQRCGSTLAQVMACCLTAPSHYMNQCWLIISGIHLRTISQEIPQPSITRISLKIVYLQFLSNLPGANELNSQQTCHIFHSGASYRVPVVTQISASRDSFICVPWHHQADVRSLYNLVPIMWGSRLRGIDPSFSGHCEKI